MAEKIEGYELSKFGFVHVTGLTVRNSPTMTPFVVEASIAALGTWGTNNGYTVVVTERGKVWLSYCHNRPETVPGEYRATLRQICPNGGDMGGPTAFCAIVGGHEQILTHELLSRMVDPAWEPPSR